MEPLLFFIGILVFFWLVIWPIIIFSLLSGIRGNLHQELAALRRELLRLKESGLTTSPAKPIHSHPETSKPIPEKKSIGLTDSDHFANELKSQPQPDEPMVPVSHSLTPPPLPTPPPPIPEIPAPTIKKVPSFLAHEEKESPPLRPPIKAASPSRFETAAQEALTKVWNWIIIGQENLPKGVSWEFALASQWLLRIGILILVLGLSFFVKYSIDHDLITREARVLFTALAGMTLLLGGTRLLGGKYHLLGQGLMGGGLTTLYFSVFAAANLYHLISAPIAFLLMGLITALAGGISIWFSSILVAVLGVLGGYGTPVLISTGEFHFPPLFGYMLILGTGVFFVCMYKQWPLVQHLAFLCNSILYYSALQKYEVTNFNEVFPFSVAFFVLFSTMAFVHHLVHRSKSNLLDLLGLILNAFVFYQSGFSMLDEIYGRNGCAALSLSLAFFYAGHVFVFLRWKVLDRELLISFLGMAAFFITLTMPLLLSRGWVTSSWAIQAVVMIWMSQKLGTQFLRQLAYLLILVVFVRMSIWDLPSRFGAYDSGMDRDVYLWALAERAGQFGVPLVALFTAGWLVKRDSGSKVEGPMGGNDTPELLEGGIVQAILVPVVILFSFAYFFLEINQTATFFYDPLRLPLLTVVIVFLGIAASFVLTATSPGTTLAPVVLWIILLVLVFKLFMVDLPSWGLQRDWLYRPPYLFRDVAFRGLDFGSAILLFLGVGWFFSGVSATKKAGPFFIAGALLLSLVYLTLETTNLLHYLDMEGLKSGGVSIVWSVYALGLILWGILKRERLIRFAGLGLFATVAGKVFLVDLANLDPFYRIIAFIILGILLLAGSFVYLKYQSNFLEKDETTPH